jgi:hypothetical protein
MFRKILKDRDEITDYIVEFASNYVDVDLVRDYFFGCKGVLQKVPIKTIRPGDRDTHMRDKKKEMIYEILPLKTMPPLIVRDGEVLDGNHRLRVAKKRGQKEILIYNILPIEL